MFLICVHGHVRQAKNASCFKLAVPLLPSVTIRVLKTSCELLCAVRSYEPNYSWTPLMTVGLAMHSASPEMQGALPKSCSDFSALLDHVFLVNLFFPPSFLPFSYVCFILLQYFPLLDFNARIMALQARSNRRNASLSQGLLICFGNAVCLQIPDRLPPLVNTWTKLPQLYLFFFCWRMTYCSQSNPTFIWFLFYCGKDPRKF